MKIYPVSFIANSVEFGRGHKSGTNTLPLTEKLEEQMHTTQSSAEAFQEFIDDALSKLEPEQEAAIRGRFGIKQEAQSKREIAEDLGIPGREIEVTRARKSGLRELKKYLELQGYRP